MLRVYFCVISYYSRARARYYLRGGKKVSANVIQFRVRRRREGWARMLLLTVVFNLVCEAKGDCKRERFIFQKGQLRDLYLCVYLLEGA